MTRVARYRHTSAVAWAALLCVPLILSPAHADAHVGSPQVFHEGMAGPYKLFVTVRPPEVIPGIATVDMRFAGNAAGDVQVVTIVPTPLTGEGANLAPRADQTVRAPADPALFSGRLWIMEKGAWRVRVHVSGGIGAGDLDVPVAAMPLRTRQMSVGLGALLGLLMTLLVAAMVGIARAAVGEAQIEPGTSFVFASESSGVAINVRTRVRLAAIIATAVTVGAVALGLLWWRSEARVYGSLVYRPMTLTATVSGRQLTLVIAAPKTASVSTRQRFRRILAPPLQGTDDFLPDHGHLMHLFLVRRPDEDAILHLHPDRTDPGRFAQILPAAPSGHYQIFADIVHSNGLPETLTATVDLPPGGEAPKGDDAVGASPVDRGGDGAAARGPSDARSTTVVLSDGTRVTWVRDEAGALHSARALWFRFLIAQANGQPAVDVVPYMGMAGHAVFLARDLSVFAHVHPSGSVPMAALALASPVGAHAKHDMHAGHHVAALPPEVSFPYGFPRPGAYRVFVQFKRGDTIETAAFDAVAD